MRHLSQDSYIPSQQTRKKADVESLAQQWAKKYVQNLELASEDEVSLDKLNWSEAISQKGREQTAQRLVESLRFASAQAWNKTEALLAKEVKRHRLNSKLINPWEIAADSFRIYDKALEVYTQQTLPQCLSVVMERLAESSREHAQEIYMEQVAPCHLSTAIGPDIGAIRKKYTTHDPRVIGFVSMQFHYTSQTLLELLSPGEQRLVAAYFKVIDDHLYMPLQRAYEAAAQHDYDDSPALLAVQQLLPVSTEIAEQIVERVIHLYPTYRSYTGFLNKPVVKTSSIRDVEMFQVYLWVCTLEGNISAIQQELFPLCVMLYPTLKVKWEIVRQMLHLLSQQIRDRLSSKQAATLLPCFKTLWEMFSPEVFPDTLDQNRTSLIS